MQTRVNVQHLSKFVASLLNIAREHSQNTITVRNCLRDRYLQEFVNFKPVEQAAFTLYALQNPAQVKFDIVQAKQVINNANYKTTASDLAIVFHIENDSGSVYYYNPLQGTRLILAWARKYYKTYTYDDYLVNLVKSTVAQK